MLATIPLLAAQPAAAAAAAAAAEGDDAIRYYCEEVVAIGRPSRRHGEPSNARYSFNFRVKSVLHGRPYGSNVVVFNEKDRLLDDDSDYLLLLYPTGHAGYDVRLAVPWRQRTPVRIAQRCDK